jgi:hypothetical protein
MFRPEVVRAFAARSQDFLAVSDHFRYQRQRGAY